MSVPTGDRTSFAIEAEPETRLRREVEADEPFHLVVIGDFSGRGDGPEIFPVDRDDFDAAFARLRPQVELEPFGPIEFASLDGFSPDELVGTLPAFARYRELRSRLTDPENAKEAIAELTGQRQEEARAAPVVAAPGGSLLDAIVGDSTLTEVPEAGDALAAFIERVMRPHLDSPRDPRAAELQQSLDEVAFSALRELLHAPAFRDREGCWRSLHRIVRTLETSAGLGVYLVDCALNHFIDNPKKLLSILRERSPIGAIATCWSFGVSTLPALLQAGHMARNCSAPLLAEADLSLLDSPDEWDAFRTSADAAWVGIVLPRVLLRLPWGADTSPCETMAFEEIKAAPQSTDLLWCNPAPLAGMLIAQAFEQFGWSMRPGDVSRIESLPIYTSRQNGQLTTFLPAETQLSDLAFEALVDNGMIPVLAEGETGAVRIPVFRSTAAGRVPLRGRWGSHPG